MRHHMPLFFGRHRGGGIGRFGRGFTEGFDGDGLGGRAFGRGRKLASVDLQLLILGLLGEKPYHGYEIIKALEERTKGFYTPSPGMVYPALTYLEEIGHATVEQDGTRKRYHISDEGRRHLEANRATADAMFAQFERVGEKMERVRRAVEAVGDEARGSEELLEARRDLRAALRDKADAPREEQQRIALVLKRATADILGKPPG